MKLFLILSMTLGAGSYAVAENTDIDQTINESVHSFINRINRRHPKISLENIRENGFPYPGDTYLESLSDDQETILFSFIDQINATYDFANMTDDELKETLFIIREDLKDLSIEYDLPNYHDFMMDVRTVEYIRENGFTFPSNHLYDQLDEDQKILVDEFIDNINQTYDVNTMTDEEILEVFDTVKTEFRELLDSMNIRFEQSTIKERIQQRVLNNSLEDDVFILPDRFFNDLTSEQAIIINNFVDNVNATYDFTNLTDEEKIETLKLIYSDLRSLLDEQDIDLPKPPRNCHK